MSDNQNDTTLAGKGLGWVSNIKSLTNALIESANGVNNKLHANGYLKYSKILTKVTGPVGKALEFSGADNKAKWSLGGVAGVVGGAVAGVIFAPVIGSGVLLAGASLVFGTAFAYGAGYAYDNSDTVRKNADNAWNKVTNAIKGANAGDGVTDIEKNRRNYLEQQKIAKKSEEAKTEMASLQQQLKAEKARLAGQADSSSDSSSGLSISSDSGSSSIMLAVNDNHIKQHLLIV